VFWGDLGGNATQPSGVYWQQFDPDNNPSSGDEYTLISWENWKMKGAVTSLNFQLKILEGTGSIEYQYGDMTAQSPASAPLWASGSAATIWLESLDAKYAMPICIYKQNAIQPHTGYRFTYTP
jgi:hypothetical protein